MNWNTSMNTKKKNNLVSLKNFILTQNNLPLYAFNNTYCTNPTFLFIYLFFISFCSLLVVY